MNVAVVAPAVTVTADCTASRDEVLERTTTAPPVGAAALKFTLHVPADPLFKEDGQTSPVSDGAGAITVTTAAFETPFAEAVTFTLCVALTAPAVTPNVALAAPAATVTDAGTLRLPAALDVSATEIPPVGAAALNVTLHVPAAPLFKEDGQASAVSEGAGATTLTAAVFETLFAEAVTFTLCVAFTTPAVTPKVALAAPAATVTDAGTLRLAAALDVSATEIPPVGAAALNVTLHVPAAPLFKEDGQASAVSEGAGATTLTAAVFETPFAEAVTFTLCVALTAPAVTPKVALAAPAATVTDAGTLRLAAALDVSATEIPPVGAAALNVTLHVPAAPLFKEDGQASAVSDGAGAGAATVTVPGEDERVSTAAARVTPKLPPIVMVTGPVTAGVAVTVATTPFAITWLFIPAATQLYALAVAEHVSVFPPALRAGPAAAAKLLKLLAGNVNVHCMAAGSLPAGDVIASANGTGVPTVVVPDERASVCAWTLGTDTKKAPMAMATTGETRTFRCIHRQLNSANHYTSVPKRLAALLF